MPSFKVWDSIKLDTLTHSFLVCGIYNTLDGSQDHLVLHVLPSVEMETEEDEEADVDEVDPLVMILTLILSDCTMYACVKQ